jgi:uncharacterized Zn finger protein
MTTNRVPYATERTCCDEPGDVTTTRDEQDTLGVPTVWVRCRECGQIHNAEKATSSGTNNA